METGNRCSAGTGGFSGSSVMSDVQVRRRERVGFDEGAAGLDGVAHQDGEELVGLDGVLDGPYVLRRKDDEKRVGTLAEAAEAILDSAKKGLTASRYKGLGEMNPEQLWETTMDPQVRTLLQVQIKDAIEADTMFTILMGDQVDPRREFIQKHALQVRNLDI